MYHASLRRARPALLKMLDFDFSRYFSRSLSLLLYLYLSFLISISLSLTLDRVKAQAKSDLRGATTYRKNLNRWPTSFGISRILLRIQGLLGSWPLHKVNSPMNRQHNIQIGNSKQ